MWFPMPKRKRPPERFAPNVARKALNASLRLLGAFLTHFLSEGKENAPRRS